jgi:hypothetical protein
MDPWLEKSCSRSFVWCIHVFVTSCWCNRLGAERSVEDMINGPRKNLTSYRRSVTTEPRAFMLLLRLGSLNHAFTALNARKHSRLPSHTRDPCACATPKKVVAKAREHCFMTGFFKKITLMACYQQILEEYLHWSFIVYDKVREGLNFLHRGVRRESRSCDTLPMS